MKFKKIIVTTVATTLFLGGAALSASAEEEMPSADLSVSLLSKYVWRGYELSNDSIVIQPSMTVGYKGFGFNLWGNLDTDQDEELFGTDGGNWNETDMTLSYDGSAGMVGYSIGYIYYGLDGAADSQELRPRSQGATPPLPTIRPDCQIGSISTPYWEPSSPPPRGAQ